MYVSQETPEQTTQRLLTVIAQADLNVYNGLYSFEEFEADQLTSRLQMDALALVRDGHLWSQLVPAPASAQERFKIFSFHFQDNLDNSGFVGWLATLLKQKLGTGVFVVCGQNSARGGIFDYWGCPEAVGDAVISEVQALVRGENR